jgi:5-methylcytosine-specific restriction protein A
MGQRWWEYKNNYLKQHPYCDICGCLAEQVHHIIPRSECPEMMYDWTNLQSLCKKCHIHTHKGPGGSEL